MIVALTAMVLGVVAQPSEPDTEVPNGAGPASVLEAEALELAEDRAVLLTRTIHAADLRWADDAAELGPEMSELLVAVEAPPSEINALAARELATSIGSEEFSTPTWEVVTDLEDPAHTADDFELAIDELRDDLGLDHDGLVAALNASEIGSMLQEAFVAWVRGEETVSRTTLLAAGLLGVALLGVLLGALIRSRRQTATVLAERDMDALTGVLNRRRLDGDVGTLAHSFNGNVALLMVDIDRFKRFNDDHGHRAGDAALRGVADVISNNVRPGDLVYRYGGEEFTILLPGTSTEDAVRIAERIRAAVAGAILADEGGRALPSVTVSIGAAVGAAAELTESLDAADGALYEAKDTGRDRVVVAS